MNINAMVYAACVCITIPASGMFANYKVKARIHVYNEWQKPVTNAIVKIYTRKDLVASLGRSGSPKREIVAACDLNGLAIAEFPCYTGEFSCYVEAEGYYGEYERGIRLRCGTPGFFSEDLLEHEKNVTFTLRKIRNPIPMYYNMLGSTYKAPRPSGCFGFDLKMNDWVRPYGKGEIADFELNYDCHWDSTNHLCKGSLDFLEKDAGAYKRKFHASKSFMLDYVADTNMMFAHSIPFYVSAGTDRIKDRFNYIRNHPLKDDEFLVIRSRVRHDNQGRIVSAHYSVIVGPFKIGETFSFLSSYFNPTPNDTNLEYDKKNNLTPKRDRLRHRPAKE